MGEHDITYRILFSHPYLVESLIRGFLPREWVEGFDFETLEPVSEAHGTEDWSVRYNDRIWRVQWKDDGRWVYVYLMLEFQRTAPRFMAVRLLSYEGVLLEHLVKALQLGSGDLLPSVFAIVVYNGERPWSSPLDVFDLMPPAPPSMEDYLPRLRYFLLDVRRLPLARLEAMRNATACFFRLDSSPDLEHTVPAVLDLDGVLDREGHAALRRDMKRWICEVLLPTRMPGVTVDGVQRLEEVGPMLAENTLDWTAKWRTQGEAVLLSRQLERKFGDLKSGIRQRIESADADRLLEWGERLLTAQSLAEVFGDEG